MCFLRLKIKTLCDWPTVSAINRYRPLILSKALAAAACVALLLPGCRRSKDRILGAPPNGLPAPIHGNITSTGARIIWDTDRPTNSLVEFGPNSYREGRAGNTDNSATHHDVSLTGLTAGTLYHYRVSGRDELGNAIYSFDRTLTTPVNDTGAPLSFESGIAGWSAQTFIDSQAVTSIESSAAQARTGSAALLLTVGLELPGHANRTKGEALLDFKVTTPLGVGMDFMSLTGRTLTVWIFAPMGALGDPSAPNFMQLFVKDAAGNSQYGGAVNVSENAWFSVTMTPNVSGAGNSFTSPGFDPTQVNTAGVKIGIGGASTITYDGPIYADDFGF
jgi:hypothetical protein